MKIALAQTNPVIGDFARNCRSVVEMIRKAAEAGCGLVVFPELTLCGYPPQDLLLRPAFVAAHDRALAGVIAAIPSGIGVVLGGIAVNTSGCGRDLYNSAFFCTRGSIQGGIRKKLLPTYDVFDESRYFEPGSTTSLFHWQDVTFGVTICEDIWGLDAASDRKGDEYSRAGRLYHCDPVVELFAAATGTISFLVNIAASPFHTGKGGLREAMFRRLCTQHNAALVYVNQAGGQDSLVFDGRSLVMDANGDVLARCRPFVEDLVVADLESRTGAPWPQPTRLEMVWQALVTGVRDYVRKCGFSRAVIGLSGGIDSALVCAVACEALGPENVLGVAMPSPYTSRMSVDDARRLAANCGCGFDLIAIDDVFAVMQKELAPHLPARVPAVTAQNLQARIRGNMLMALSNSTGALLLSTGNKSEMAVGYCTLYGDMSGGLSVIGDVPKTMVYELAAFVNRERVIIPERVLTRPPSAELAPDQKDEDDLPPYAVLDPILAAYLEKHQSIDAIAARGFDRETVADVVRRIRVNEYKRKQAPLCLKITTKAFGSGRRYPTAQNFREESVVPAAAPAEAAVGADATPRFPAV